MHKNLLLEFFLAKQNSWIFIFALFIFLFFTWANNHASKTITVEKAKTEPVASISVASPLIPSKSKKNINSSRTSLNTQFDSIIFKAAKQHQVDPALIKAIIMAESNYNPDALSKKGAQGLMQLMPNTAKWLGVKDSFNPEYNIHGGVKYFKQLLLQFDGNVELALAAYNAGSKRVRQYNGVPPFTATRYYITKVFKYYEHYKGKVI